MHALSLLLLLLLLLSPAAVVAASARLLLSLLCRCLLEQHRLVAGYAAW